MTTSEHEWLDNFVRLRDDTDKLSTAERALVTELNRYWRNRELTGPFRMGIYLMAAKYEDQPN